MDMEKQRTLKRKHICIVDDDEHIGNMLEEMLMKEGYCVSRAYSGTEAILLLEKLRPDLILLDLMLPGLQGEEVLPKIQDIPVIVLSAKMDIDHKVELLLNGAVDYITKPFHRKELLARIAIHLRATPHTTDTVLKFRDIQLDTITHMVDVLGRDIKLTKTEYRILKQLMQHPTQVLTKSLLLDSISEDTPDCSESSLKMHISNLRKKLRGNSSTEYIEAVWGIGFKLKSE